jgi:hypothetical protein
LLLGAAACAGGREVMRGVADARRLATLLCCAGDAVLLLGECSSGCWLVGRLRCGTSARLGGVL